MSQSNQTWLEFISKIEMQQRLYDRQLDFAPLISKNVQVEIKQKNFRLDAFVDLEWNGVVFPFVVEIQGGYVPLSSIWHVMERVTNYAKLSKRYPMIYIHYIPNEAKQMLSDAGISGVDLCGNLFINIAGKVYIERLGSPNLFPSAPSIRNIYRKSCSLVPRMFLLKSQFDSMTDLVINLQQRKGNLNQSTVSKVCRQLEENLIIKKQKGTSFNQKNLVLIQPEKLLEQLEKNYTQVYSPNVRTAKLKISQTEFLERLVRWEKSSGERIVQTGISGASAYTVMVRENVLSFYCDNVSKVLSEFESDLEETSRFADVRFTEPSENFVYFDSRKNLLPSPIQSYLELINSDKREQQAAETIRQNLLNHNQ
ncbi:MAG: hypothetical protein LBK06_11085 [Planctomycetaceae bacterium]|jgi:hypothetical protein|nr:hypothetical protein [Planctomycetaceae bacterium]